MAQRLTEGGEAACLGAEDGGANTRHAERRLAPRVGPSDPGGIALTQP